jgi:two-component system, LytTR family, response regulator
MPADSVRGTVTVALNALIVDDEALARRGLRLRLQRIADVRIVGESRNGREALSDIARTSPDVVFLDIQMPGLNGFDVVRELQADTLPMIVFVTAFDQYAVNAFEVHAVDYLLKPVEQPRLESAVRRAVEIRAAATQSERKSRLMDLIVALTGHSAQTIEALVDERGTRGFRETLTIRDGHHVLRVAASAIEWIDAAGDYMCIHVDGRTHVMRVTLKQLEALLDPALFLRIHRSTLINATLVKEVEPHDNGEFYVTLARGTRLKVSRSYRDKILRFL